MPPPPISALSRARHSGLLRLVLGRFDPTGLHLALHWEDSDEQPYENRVAAMGALLHERTHWLQFVGTAAGQFSAWLSTLQAGMLLYDLAGQPPLDESDLPLLGNDRVSKQRRELWYACERVYATLFGAPKTYFEQLDSRSKGFGATELGMHLRELGSKLVDEDEAFERYQESVAGTEPLGKSVMVMDDGGASFGGVHLMEGMARLNELFRLSDGIRAKEEGMEVDADAYLFPPYSNARNVYFEATGREPGRVEDEMAICVLADWALNCPLPPLLPLRAVLGENAALLPGPFFIWLAQNLDVEAIGPQPEETRATWADGFTRAIYDQISKRAEVTTPMEVAKANLGVLGGLESMSIPESIYEISHEEKSWRPADDAARLRYLSILARRAWRIRLKHPAFFPLPHSYYSTDRALFHEFWDQIQPPIVSIGRKRMVPTVADPGWFAFFYSSAIHHEMGMSAADCDCALLGRRLAAYRGTYLGDQADVLLEHSVKDIIGDGPAARAVLAAAGL